jgi:hypothetical protein
MTLRPWQGILLTLAAVAASTSVARAQLPVRILTPPPADEPLSRPTGGPPLLSPEWAVGMLDDASAHGHWVGGAGFYLLQPSFEHNVAFTARTSVSPSGPIPVAFASSGNLGISGAPTGAIAAAVPPVQTVNLSSLTPFHTELGAAPQLWVGYVSDSGLGVRGRWWQFEQGYSQGVVNPVATDTTTSTTISSATPLGLGVTSFSNTNLADPIAITSRLTISVWDMEATEDVQLGGLNLTFAGGLRYVHLAERYNVYRNRTGTEVFAGGSTTLLQDSDTLESGHSFNGLGPTLAMDARRDIGGGWSLFGTMRGSAVFGRSKARASQATVQVSQTQSLVVPQPIAFNLSMSGPIPVPTANVNQNGTLLGPSLVTNTTTVSNFNEATSGGDDILPIGEMELGIEYTRNWGRMRFFGQAAFVGQAWFGAGGPAEADGNLGLIGLSVRTGVTY